VVTSILLLRHAQSTWNEAGRWQGWADPPLSGEGESVARAAAGHEALAGIEAAAASDLQRAARTAELLRGTRPWPPVRRYRGLRERGAGHWTALTRAQIEKGWPGALTPPVAAIVGGEAPAAVTARAVATLHRIAAEWPRRRVLAVTHGALIRLVEAHLGEASTVLPNLAGRWVEVDGGVLSLGERVGPLGAAVPTGNGSAVR
jgi:2,3-bisphosphoglycerate-dependent phosphoglycerate mutase